MIRTFTSIPLLAALVLASGALPLVKPLMTDLSDKEKPVYFCVDETSQRQRAVAEMIAAEGIWDLPWTISAAEAQGGDVANMRNWLDAWAPTRYAK